MMICCLFVCTDMSHNSTDPFSEPTEYEYLKKVMFEYMMGRETKVLFGVIFSLCDDVIKHITKTQINMKNLKNMNNYCNSI